MYGTITGASRKIALMALLVMVSSGCAAMLLDGSGAPAAEQGTGTMSDSAITSSVRSRLLRDSSIEAGGIDIRTRAGRVTLSGEVSSFGEREKAGRLAASVGGVAAVDNRLLVRDGN